jgi:hypothetical protein
MNENVNEPEPINNAIIEAIDFLTFKSNEFIG